MSVASAIAAAPAAIEGIEAIAKLLHGAGAGQDGRMTIVSFFALVEQIFEHLKALGVLYDDAEPVVAKIALALKPVEHDIFAEVAVAEHQLVGAMQSFLHHKKGASVSEGSVQSAAAPAKLLH